MCKPLNTKKNREMRFGLVQSSEHFISSWYFLYYLTTQHTLILVLLRVLLKTATNGFLV